MPPKGTVATHTSGQGSTTSDPFLHGSEGSTPESTGTNEEGVWKRQGRLRAQARESPRAPTLTHARTTPPSTKHISTAQHTKQSPAGQRGQGKTAQAHQRANNLFTVVSQATHPTPTVAPEPLPEVGRGPSGAADASASDSDDNNSDDQDQAAAEQEHDYTSVRETWEARETEAAVDEARRKPSALELRKDRDAIATLSELGNKYFGKVKDLRHMTDDDLYQAAITIAVAMGYTEDHVYVPEVKYKFLDVIASMLDQHGASPSMITNVVLKTAKTPDHHIVLDYVHAILHMISNEEIAPRVPTSLQSARMPWPLTPSRVPDYTGSKHYEGANEAGAPARVENIQGDNKPSTSRRPPDPCLSVHAGTGSPDMNKLTHPSASEESVTSGTPRTAQHMNISIKRMSTKNKTPRDIWRMRSRTTSPP